MAKCFVPEEQEESSEQSPPPPAQAVAPHQLDYDFVQPPDQDFYCPVTLDILEEPLQTVCCGQHISQQAANRILRDGKPCPLCKDENFATQGDKYFKRKVKELKGRCPYKKSGCVWVGEPRDHNLHCTACPKRPWKCQHCNYETTYEVGTQDHTPKCTKYPESCPNRCVIGIVPRCEVENHLLVCPMQLVECGFANAGCDVKVPRRDLPRHMSESAQQHLMSATLLNLRLTRELTQKMEEKDKQITEVKQQVVQLDAKMDAQFKQQTTELNTQVEQQTTELNAKMDTQFRQQAKEVQQVRQAADKNSETVQQTVVELNTKVETMFQQHGREFNTKVDAKFDKHTKELDQKFEVLERKVTELHDQEDQQLKKVCRIVEEISTSQRLISQGFTCHEFTLTEFEKHQRKGGSGDWNTDQFYSYPGGYCFKLNICTNGCDAHLTAYFSSQHGDYDKDLKWPVKCTVHLQLLNQRGDHGHHMAVGRAEGSKPGLLYCFIDNTKDMAKFFPLAELGYNADKNTEYLKNDSLHFRMYLKVEPK